MKVLLTGANGQVGRALQATVPEGWTLVATDRERLDIASEAAIHAVVGREQPDWIVNAAAYTAVDRAESEQSLASAINADAPRELARAAAGNGSRLLQLSTDFVFAGDQALPYTPESTPAPLNAYGATKLAGELAVRRELEAALILRTSWVYASHGTNFVLRMLELMRTRPELNIVYDQVGSPTWNRSLARCTWGLLLGSVSPGIYHWCDGGVASWYDFASAIQEEALSRGMLDRPIPLRAIRSAQYPTPARRPPYSVLDTSSTALALGRSPDHWRSNLRRMLDELRTA